MVRLEKSIYELLLNTPTLHRARKISSPRKWFTETRWRFMTVAAHKFCAEGLTAKFYRAIEPFFAKFFYRYVRDIATSRGLAWEDFFLFQDRELRRCVVHENILRMGSHPYQHILFAHRRARFYKVERAVRGFEVPDYLKNEAKGRLVSETVKNMQTWGDYVTQHFYSDMTPTTHSTPIARWHPLEIFLAYGSMSQQAWERYFYNEVVYDEYTVEDEKEAQNPFGKLNFANADDRAHFETEVKRFIKLYPGSIVADGENFDFKAFYAGWALNHKKEVPGIKSDDSLIEDAKKKIEKYEDRLELPGKKHKSAVKVGSVMPKFIRDQQGTKAILH